MSKFKVGDRVLKNGDIDTIEKHDTAYRTRYPWFLKSGYWARTDELELVEAAGTAEVKTSTKFEVGDKVTRIDGVFEGDIWTVTEVRQESNDYGTIAPGETSPTFYSQGALRLIEDGKEEEEEEEESKFKAGDKVKVLKRSSSKFGFSGTVTNNDGDGEGQRPWLIKFDDGDGIRVNAVDVELISDNNIITNMIEKFKDMFTSEPEKSLKKAGLLENGMVTDDGVKMYITWLMKEDTTFLDKVVKELIKDEKKSK